MNCIGLALKNLDIKFELYASEIDKFSIKVSDTLFPNTINLGDITKINLKNLPVFDLVVGGSPCQGFSFAGKRLNFSDPRSKLFFEFMKILNFCKKKNPNIKFLLENVKMEKKEQHIITKFIGIEPIEINSSLLSSQNRKRLYWTNIGTNKRNLFRIEQPGIKQPKDKGILLENILDKNVPAKYNISKKGFDFITNPMRLNKKFTAIGGKKSLCLTAKGQTNWTGTFIRIKEATKKAYTEIYPGECFDLNYKESKSRRGRKMKFKSHTLTAKKIEFYTFEIDRIRRLTPKECARLQTIPNWAIKKMLNCGVSDSQLYKMLGNGWTVEVISYIFSHNKWQQ